MPESGVIIDDDGDLKNLQAIVDISLDLDISIDCGNKIKFCVETNDFDYFPFSFCLYVLLSSFIFVLTVDI